ncbi:MAG: hypothetical protein KA354_13505 [Phycisphaerae bacterium]|nr:hypothetical protein [Phycisphaerae bacterium]
MSQDRIEQLLRQSDRLAGPPPLLAGRLSDRVRARVKRQRWWRIAGGSVAAVAGVAACLALLPTVPWGQPSEDGRPIVQVDGQGPTSRKTNLAAVQEQIAALRAEIRQLRGELRAALADNRMQAGAEQAALVDKAADAPMADTLARFDQELERTAFLMVYQADRAYRELNLRDAAARSYRQTIELFPGTNAASVARKRLVELETSKGDRL